MTHKSEMSDELLHAFISGELGADDIHRVYTAMEKDESVRVKIQELSALRKLLKKTYASKDLQAKPTISQQPWFSNQLGLIAASLFVALALSMSWIGYAMYEAPQSGANISPVAATENAQELPVKVVFHVSQSESGAFKQVLNQVENLVREFQDNPEQIEIEVVANGAGMKLFEAKGSQLNSRMNAAGLRYTNVKFLGCENTYHRMTQQRGAEPKLLPVVSMIQSGIMHILRRQKQGWVYIQT